MGLKIQFLINFFLYFLVRNELSDDNTESSWMIFCAVVLPKFTQGILILHATFWLEN